MQQITEQAQALAKENEQLKADKTVETQRTQADAERAAAEIQLKQGDQQLKAQEIQLKASQPVVAPQEQWEYDMQMAREQRAFEAEQAALNREADIAKALISKAEDGSDIDATAIAGEIVEALTAALNAPVTVVRDPVTGEVLGGV